jgi:hypothetical protein
LTGCETPGEFLIVEKLLGGHAILDDLHRPFAVYVFNANTVLLIVAHACTPHNNLGKKPCARQSSKSQNRTDPAVRIELDAHAIKSKAATRRHDMTTRYATIITDDAAQEIVSIIGQFEGGAPQVRNGTVEQVADGVLIGMVRGGPIDAVDGFGFPEGAPGASGRAVGIARANEAAERHAKSVKTGRRGKAKDAAAAGETIDPDAKTDA